MASAGDVRARRPVEGPPAGGVSVHRSGRSPEMTEGCSSIRVRWSWVEMGPAATRGSRRRRLLGRLLPLFAACFVAWRLAPRSVALAVVAGVAIALIGSTQAAERFVQQVARGIASAVSWAMFVPVALVSVIGPWVLRPVIGGGPMTVTRSACSAWGLVRVRRIDPARPWAPLRAWEDEAPRVRWQRRIGTAVLVLGVLAGVLALADRAQEPQPRRAYSLSEPTGVQANAGIPAAFADASWYPKYRDELEYAATWLGGAQVIDNTKIPDGHTTYLNVIDGHRVSWAPPACTCPRLSVWVYGASTTFGLGQRDDHTIPSELARAAWADGYALDVVNRGVPGEEHWQEANRLRWDLTRQPSPDLVVFYDGASEIVGASWLEEHHLGDVAEPIEPLTAGFLASDVVVDAMRDAKTGGSTQPPLPSGAWAVPSSTVPSRTPRQVGEVAVQRYERARTMSKDLADVHHLDVHWYWQPTRFSRPTVMGEPTTGDDARSQAISEAARAALPSGVVDLSDALVGSDAPIFSDDVHHNELGARLVAAAMYRDLRPTIAALAGARRGG